MRLKKNKYLNAKCKLAHPRATFLLCCTVSLIKKDIRRRQRGRFNLGEFGKHSNTHNHRHRHRHMYIHTQSVQREYQSNSMC